MGNKLILGNILVRRVYDNPENAFGSADPAVTAKIPSHFEYEWIGLPSWVIAVSYDFMNTFSLDMLPWSLTEIIRDDQRQTAYFVRSEFLTFYN